MPSRDANSNGQEASTKGGPSSLALALLGAIGFGAGFSIVCAIDATEFDIIKNTIASIFPGTAVGPQGGFIRGIITGAIGGAALGLGFKRKNHILWLALAGAIGFGIAFANITLLALLVDISAEGAVWGGALIGAVGGLTLGLASTRGSIPRSLLVGAAGAVSFAFVFALRFAVYHDDQCSSWNGFGGAVVGAALGLAIGVGFKGSTRGNS
jgi:hypothetical protein